MKVHIITYGCTANQADSQIMGAVLEKEGHQLSDLASSDYILVNTCAVKQATENKIISRLSKLSKTGKKIIIGGCLTTISQERIRKAVPNFSGILDTKSVDKLGEIIEKSESGSSGLVVFSDKPPVKPNMVKHLSGSTSGIIQLSEGCNLSCAYCATTIARGDMVCFSPDVVVRAASYLAKSGCKEILLTSQDNGAYMHGKTMLPELLRKVCSIESEFFVRNGMSNPVYMNLILKELIEAYKHPKVYKFLHIPVQSGSDAILKAMKRGYKISLFKKIIRDFRKEIPELTISTDIIVGFPNETEEDFQKTIKLIVETNPDVVNISKYGKRPGTAAAKMEQVDAETVNRRSAKLAEISRKISLEKNKALIGWKGKALVNSDLTCKTPFYKQVRVAGSEKFVGKLIEVEVVGCTQANLIGKLL